MKTSLFIIAIFTTLFLNLKVSAQVSDRITGAQVAQTPAYFAPGALIVQSHNGLYKLYYQPDGNIVLYNPQMTALWASGPLTNNPGYCTFDVSKTIKAIYNGSSVLWSYTPPYPNQTNNSYTNNFYWVLQDDGNFVFYYLGDGTGQYSVSTGTDGGRRSGNFGTLK